MVSGSTQTGTFYNRAFKIKGGFNMIVKLPTKVKTYLDSGRKKIINVTPIENFRLKVTFDNKEIRLYNMSNQLTGVFEILKDKSKFDMVFLDEAGNIAWDRDLSIDSSKIWNNRIDLCSDSVYMDSIPYNHRNHVL